MKIILSKKYIFLWLFFISIFSLLIFFYFSYNNTDDQENLDTKKLISCNINGNFLNSDNFKEYWDKEIELNIENNLWENEKKERKKILDVNILECQYKNKRWKNIDFNDLSPDIKEKSKNFFSVIKSNIPSFFDYNEDNTTISLIGINETKFKNKFEIKRLDSFTPSFRVKKRTSFSDMVDELLKSYETKYNDNKLFAGYFKIDIHNGEIPEFEEMVKIYGEDIIVSNFKLYLDLTEKEKQILSEYTPSKELEDLFKLNNVFNNAFIYSNKYVILRDSMAIVNGIQKKREDPVDTFKYQQIDKTEEKIKLPSIEKLQQLKKEQNKKPDLSELKEKLKLLNNKK